MHTPSSRETTLSVADSRDSETDVTVRYLAAGSGPPVVLLHGIGLDAAAVSWKHILPELARDRTVYALDLPGHGESEKPRTRYTTQYFQRVLAAFLDDQGIEGAPLVGVSMGGAVALGHALDGGDPERLVLLDSYGLGGDAYWRPAATTALWMPGFGNHLWSAVGSSKTAVRSSLSSMTGRAPSEPFVEDVFETVQDPDVVRTMRKWQRSEFRAHGLKTDYSDRLGELAQPTLLVHGADDPLIPPAWSRRANEALARSDLALVEDCGHWPTRERPEKVTGLLVEFLNGERRQASD